MKTNILIFLIISIFLFTPIEAQIGLSAGGGVYFPIGELAKAYNTGYGGEASFIYRLNPNFEIALVGGVSLYDADQEDLNRRLLEQIGDIGEGINIDAQINVEAPLKLYPLVFNIKYLFGKKNEVYDGNS